MREVSSTPFEIDGWRYSPDIIFKQVNTWVFKEESVGIFRRYKLDPDEDESFEEDDSPYIGICDHAVACPKWRFRKLEHAEFREFRAILEASSVPLASGNVFRSAGYSSLIVKGARTTISLTWDTIPQKWEGVEDLCAFLLKLKHEQF